MGHSTYTIKHTPARRKSRLPLILFIAAAAVAGVFLWLFFGTTVFVDKSATLTLTERPVSSTCEGFTDGLISLDGGILSSFSMEGELLWEADAGSDLTELAVSDAAIAAYNDSYAVFYDHTAAPLFISDMDTMISNVVCGTEIVGVMVTQRAEADSSSFLYIYDLKGTELSRIEFAHKQVLMSGIYGEGDSIYVLTMDTSGVVPVSYITTYKSDGTITGSISINTQLIDNVAVSDTQIFASGTNSLVSYSYFGEKQQESLIYGWQPYESFVSGSDTMMLYVTRGSHSLYEGELLSVKVIDEALEEIMIYFPEPLMYACCSQTRIYAFGSRSIYVYDETGSLINTIESETVITKAQSLSNGYAIVWDGVDSRIIKLS